MVHWDLVPTVIVGIMIGALLWAFACWALAGLLLVAANVLGKSQRKKPSAFSDETDPYPLRVPKFWLK